MGNLNSIYEAYGDLIVHDEYLKKLGQAIEDVCRDMNETYCRFIEILREIKDYAITEGDTHEAIAAFVTVLESLGEQVNDAGASMKLTIDDFVYQIDEKDKYLY